jgi:hypothetical protein
MDTHVFKVGDFARNIESGWLGKIVAIKTETVRIDETRWYDDTMAEMIGVDELARMVAGLSCEAALASNDRQWHSIDDLVKFR